MSFEYRVIRKCEGHAAQALCDTFEKAELTALGMANACSLDAVHEPSVLRDGPWLVWLPCHGSRIWIHRADTGVWVAELAMIPGKGWCRKVGDGWRKITKAQFIKGVRATPITLLGRRGYVSAAEWAARGAAT